MAKRFIKYHYKRHHSMFDSTCFYCGDLADSKDHVPPISLDGEIEGIDRILVRCCILCNSILSNRQIFELLHSCDFLFARYQYKFRRVLSLPNWHEDELNELSGRLKRTVILGLKKKAHIEKKLLHLNIKILDLQGY